MVQDFLDTIPPVMGVTVQEEVAAKVTANVAGGGEGEDVAALTVAAKVALKTEFFNSVIAEVMGNAAVVGDGHQVRRV